MKDVKNENFATPSQGASNVIKLQPKQIGCGNKKIRCRKCRHAFFWLDNIGAECDACGYWTDLESAMGAI